MAQLEVMTLENLTQYDGLIKEYVRDVVKTVDDKVGVIPEGYEATTIAEYAKELVDNVSANGYDDTTVKSLIQGNTDAIATLVDEDTNKSVRTIANEELAKQLIPETALESLDTLEEIATWIQSHPNDASAINKAITDLQTLVGTLPEETTATTIVGYIVEVVTSEKARAEGIETGLQTRLSAVETLVGEGCSAISSDSISALFA